MAKKKIATETVSERKKVIRRITSIAYSSLESIISEVDRTIAAYPELNLTYKDFVLDTYSESYSDNDYPCLEYYTFEDDREYQKRLKEEAENAERIKEYELKQLALLKKKYKS